MVTNEDEFFRQATLRICGNLDFEIALQECLLYLKTIMPADSFHLNLYDQGLTALRTIAIATPTNAQKTNIVLPLDKKGIIFLDDQNLPSVLIVNQPLAHPVSGPIIERMGNQGNRSSMIMHLAIKGKKLGNLIILAEGKNQYTEEHLRLFSILNEPFAIALSNNLKYEEVNHLKEIMTDNIRHLRRRLQRFSLSDLIGEEFGLKGVMKLVRDVALLDSPVILQGETGVGKEIIATIIHNLSKRSDGPFIRVNCGAIPETLIDTELFGHEKGSFTGAIAQKRGCFERADGGTIFLDEVAELPLLAQTRLLRVLQDKEIIRVGGSDQIKVDIRIVTATHQNLQEMIKMKLFRADLWFRLNVFPIMIPPLRNRKEDIPLLVDHLIRKKTKELQIPTPTLIAPGAIESLLFYSWPGNVRELENVIERALILNKGRPLNFFEDIIWPDIDEELPIEQLELLQLDHVVSKHIRRVLKITKGVINGPNGAAELLKVNHGTLRHRMKMLGIPYGRGKY